MSAVTTADWPAAGHPFTVAEFDRLPHDGRRYELLDGVLVVSPRPTTVHQFVAFRLAKVLDSACPEDLCVLPEPAVELDPHSELAPDLVVVDLDDVGGAKFIAPPHLVVEVRSPSTALIDLGRKKAAYERFGVPSYWVVNPDPPGPEITVFELRGGTYVTVQKTRQPFDVSTPFPVSITPADLISRLRGRD
ncbi:MAG TPA: Uma2 family endonuclease [Trebonia sp.]|nr:Uma2 family endonuclease [Trebonia sp.]